MGRMDSRRSRGIPKGRLRRNGSTGRQFPGSPRRDSARVLMGATEVLLLARDPHLAARAAWVLLKDPQQPRDPGVPVMPSTVD
jgi:hypothetical protein